VPQCKEPAGWFCDEETHCLWLTRCPWQLGEASVLWWRQCYRAGRWQGQVAGPCARWSWHPFHYTVTGPTIFKIENKLFV
jgi:hypothetical protein